MPSPLPGDRTEARLTYAGAANAALDRALRQDPTVLVYGEDVALPGGVFGVTKGLRARHGDRVFDTPISESAIIGTAIGLAMRGYRPVCEIQFDGFIFPGFDQITTQLANKKTRLNLFLPSKITSFI